MGRSAILHKELGADNVEWYACKWYTMNIKYSNKLLSFENIHFLPKNRPTGIAKVEINWNNSLLDEIKPRGSKPTLFLIHIWKWQFCSTQTTQMWSGRFQLLAWKAVMVCFFCLLHSKIYGLLHKLFLKQFLFLQRFYFNVLLSYRLKTELKQAVFL